MSRKSWLYAGAIAGSTVGSFVPSLWGAGVLSMSALVASGIGGLAGIWAVYQLL